MPRPFLLTLLTLLAVVALTQLDRGSGDRPVAEVDSGALQKKSSPSVAPAGEGEDSVDAEPSLSAALGQMIVARFTGSEPSPAFLSRIERGEVGGVILFEENLRGGRETIAGRIERLQEAASNGDNPPLLVMVDQEGGTVKRLPGPPHSSAAAMESEKAEEEGEATGELLAQLGINVDLAPVADVGHAGTFLGSRTFSSDADEVAERACDFAAGLRSAGVAATLKHFPGLGRATVNTDEAVATVTASSRDLRADYEPYRRCGGEPLTLTMVDSAIYPKLTGDEPAVMSPVTYQRELPLAGAGGVTISDDLETPAIESQVTPARRSINAGLDLLLYARTEATSEQAFTRLLDDLRGGAISRPQVRSAAAAILALKKYLSSD